MQGLLPRGYYNAARDLSLSQSKSQAFLWDEWEMMCRNVGHVDAVICNGDMVEGLNRKGKGKDVQICDMKVQCDIANTALSMIDADRFIFTQGSGYHVDDNPSNDEAICDAMGGEWFGWFGDVTFEGVTFNLQHGCPFSEDPSNRFNSQQKKVNNLALQGDEADVYIRSHTHFFAYSGSNKNLVVNTPCWKGMDGFVSTKSQQRPHNGYILFNVSGTDYSWDFHVFNIPKQIFTKQLVIK